MGVTAAGVTAAATGVVDNVLGMDAGNGFVAGGSIGFFIEAVDPIGGVC